MYSTVLLYAMRTMTLSSADPVAFADVRLVLVGGARDAEDLARVNALKKETLELRIDVCIRGTESVAGSAFLKYLQLQVRTI